MQKILDKLKIGMWWVCDWTHLWKLELLMMGYSHVLLLYFLDLQEQLVNGNSVDVALLAKSVFCWLRE